jgi:hypothetical protein
MERLGAWGQTPHRDKAPSLQLPSRCSTATTIPPSRPAPARRDPGEGRKEEDVGEMISPTPLGTFAGWNDELHHECLWMRREMTHPRRECAAICAIRRQRAAMRTIAEKNAPLYDASGSKMRRYMRHHESYGAESAHFPTNEPAKEPKKRRSNPRTNLGIDEGTREQTQELRTNPGHGLSHQVRLLIYVSNGYRHQRRLVLSRGKKSPNPRPRSCGRNPTALDGDADLGYKSSR